MLSGPAMSRWKQRKRAHRRRAAVIVATLFAILTSLTLIGLFGFDFRAPQPTVQIGGPFTLLDSNGQPVTDRTFRGKWMLVYFGYTYCPDVCPTTLNEMAEALDKLGPDAAKIAPLFITVDPERDTAAVLRNYVKAFDTRIHGLTGSPQQIAAVAREYRVFYQKSDPGKGAKDYLIDHSSLIYVMNPAGQFTAYFSHDMTADDIASGLRKFID